MTADQLQVVSQRKMDALSGKHLHELCLSPLRKWNYAVDALAITVPILLLVARLLAKGAAWGIYVDDVAEGLAAVLLVLAALKIIYGWQDKAIKHSRLRDENISLATQADALIRKGDTASSDSVEMFLMLVDRSEQADREALGTVGDAVKQKAYREALKEVAPGSTATVCPFCGASPWRFISGTCQVCGGAPVKH